jgi:hypothetical protein
VSYHRHIHGFYRVANNTVFGGSMLDLRDDFHYQPELVGRLNRLHAVISQYRFTYASFTALAGGLFLMQWPLLADHAAGYPLMGIPVLIADISGYEMEAGDDQPASYPATSRRGLPAIDLTRSGRRPTAVLALTGPGRGKRAARKLNRRPGGG